MLLSTQLLLTNRSTQLALIGAAWTAIVWILLSPVTGSSVLSYVVALISPYDGVSSTNLAIQRHPIESLIASAAREYTTLIAKETTTIRNAAEAYRKRRGRPPPPMFDVWFEYASNRSAIIVEDFFDQIYTDLNPFWGMRPDAIRARVTSSSYIISVRDGETTAKGTDIGKPRFDVWVEMVTLLQQYLPDIDIPVNLKDESRIVLPSEDIELYMAVAEHNLKDVPEMELKTTFSSYPALQPAETEFDQNMLRMVHIGHLRSQVAPKTASQKIKGQDGLKRSPAHTQWHSAWLRTRVCSNITKSRSVCENPHLQYMHGALVEPSFISSSKKLFPMFGGSKLSVNNEILMPPAMYFSSDPQYSGGQSHGGLWEEKKDSLIWRGSASGGKNTEENWTRFHRHRFVASINATEVHMAETTNNPPLNFALPAPDAYDLPAQKDGQMSEWVASWSNASFVQLLCWPWSPGLTPYCNYTDPYFFVDDSVPMNEQYAYKYLPDIDGNSYSGRYRGFLASTSLPLKATIYQEWHDSRLIPWYHFVPMDNTFIDIYGIMQYFVGYQGSQRERNVLGRIPGHDGQAKRIALQGKEWAEKVLRNEDMLIYMLRLFLEYARVCDDDRAVMGWTTDT